MSRQISPFASLTGAEKQIRWMEYQSIRLPYIQTGIETPNTLPQSQASAASHSEKEADVEHVHERPQPPPEIPRTMAEFQKSRHSQYDAVIARMKQAELQSRSYRSSQISQQPK